MNAPDLNNRPWQKSRDFISSAYYFSGDQEGLFWMLDKLEEIARPLLGAGKPAASPSNPPSSP